jgi:hypothetical protein
LPVQQNGSVSIAAENSGGSPVDLLASPNGGLITGNALTKFRDSYESYTPGVLYNEVKASGDIVRADGNTGSASYLVISKSPWNAGTETTVTSVSNFAMPLDVSLGLHMSQRALGQEFAVEVVDSGTPMTAPSEIDISALSQATTTLTVTTATNHGLSVGQAFGIYGCADSQFNYSALVVATITSPTSFTATAGPGGTIPTLTASPAALGTPKIFYRRRLGGAVDGTSIIFENATATNASIYTRSGTGDAYPTGTFAGNHSVTTLSTASVALATSFGAYSFLPTAEFRLNCALDRVQWFNQSADVATGYSQLAIRTSVCPNSGKRYLLRYRATNNKSLTVPIGKIVSVSKAGSTTATITFAAAHGLTVNDRIVIYGIADQTNFANQTTAVQVASVIGGAGSTQITVAFGASATTTSYGGYVSRVNGQQVQQGAITQVAINAAVTSGILTLTGNAAWTGFVIGDYLEVIGVRNTSTGADLGVDGAYQVRNVSTTTLVLEPLTGTVPPTTLVSTACGGGIIKRTDLRISWARIIDFERQRVEFSPRPSGDVSIALPVQIPSTVTVTGTNVSTNVNQIGAATPAVGVSSGSTNSTLSVNVASAISNVDQNATAFNGAGRVNGTVVASARGGSAVISAEINVSALTLGTATSVVFVLQESSGGTNFTDIWVSDPVATTGIVRVPPILVGGRRRWAAHSVGGTSTTVTATITALELPSGYPSIRQYRDAYSATNPFATVINTATQTATNFGATTALAATTQQTSPCVIEGCTRITAHMTLAGTPTVTTQPVVSLEVSQDLTNWFTTTTTMTAAGAGTYSATLQNVAYRYARLRVTTAAAYSAGAYTISSVGITAVG